MWLMVIFSLRYTLKLLFMYKGWIYESRGPGTRISIATRLWLAIVKVLSGWNPPRLYSFQGSLPRLPLPKVEDTMKRVKLLKKVTIKYMKSRFFNNIHVIISFQYLLSVRPLLDDKNFHRMEKLADEFQKGIAVKLQNYLRLKSWFVFHRFSQKIKCFYYIN